MSAGPFSLDRRRRLMQLLTAGGWARGALATPAAAPDSAPAPPFLLAGDVPPYSEPGDGWLDLRIAALAKQAQFGGAIQHLPWARVLKQARTQGQALVYPLARVPERESQWRWLALLAMDEMLLIVRRDALGEAQLRDPQALRGLRIGTLRESLHATRLRSEGYPLLDYAPHEASNARKLALGRVQAWAVTRAVSEHLIERERLDRTLLHAPLRRGMVALYLAATPDLNDQQLRPWLRALAPPPAGRRG